MSQSPHEEFLALCALSTSGQLTREERNRLQVHLPRCIACREALKQYDAVVRSVIPALTPDPKSLEPYPSRSRARAEAARFQRLTLEEELSADRGSGDRDRASKALGRVPLSASQATWRNVWSLCAAGVLLCIALGVSAYQAGIRRGVKTASTVAISAQKDTVALEQQVSDAAHEREVLRSQIGQRENEISSLRHQQEEQLAEISRVKNAQNQLETDVENGQASRQGLLQETADLSQKLEAARTKTQDLEDKLELLQRQGSEDQERATALEARVSDMTRLLRDREATIDQQQELLAHDRDIRDLMGARDLYVAEVYDVERTGETKKPYGRLFYTKGKSLIFYAYDLDQQAGLKNASTFQAWGRRGPDWQQALNLGILFVDNASKKRWVLRFDDAKALAQIDAVFVTVEPNGGSHKPSRKPLLFAYLHIDPNHP